MSPEGLTCLSMGWSRGIAREFGAGVAVDGRSPEAAGQAMRDGIEDGHTGFTQSGISDTDAVWGVYDTGHDSSGAVAVRVNGAEGTVERFERTACKRRESVVDGVFILSAVTSWNDSAPRGTEMCHWLTADSIRLGRTPTLGLPGEGSRHVTGQVPGVDGVAR